MTGYIMEMQERYRELATESVERRIALTVLRLAAQIGSVRVMRWRYRIDLSRGRIWRKCPGRRSSPSAGCWQTGKGSGLVEAGRERVLIRNPHGLVQISEGLDQ